MNGSKGTSQRRTNHAHRICLRQILLNLPSSREKHISLANLWSHRVPKLGHNERIFINPCVILLICLSMGFSFNAINPLASSMNRFPPLLPILPLHPFFLLRYTLIGGPYHMTSDQTKSREKLQVLRSSEHLKSVSC